MPIYDYKCKCGKKFDAYRKIEKRDEALCPNCFNFAPHVIRHAPKVDVLDYFDDGLGVHVTGRKMREKYCRDKKLEELGPTKNKRRKTIYSYGR